MFKTALVTTMSTALMLVTLTGCSDDNSGSADSAATKSKEVANTSQKPATKKVTAKRNERPKRAEMTAPKTQPLEAFQSEAIMGQPVDFSSPESISDSIEAIQQEAGDEAASRVESAIEYLLVYDLSVARNKQNLYAKLNGKTPNQILAMTNR